MQDIVIFLYPAVPLSQLYLFGRKQQCLNGLKMWEELDFFNNMHSILIADSFVKGSLICNNQYARMWPL